MWPEKKKHWANKLKSCPPTKISEEVRRYFSFSKKKNFTELKISNHSLQKVVLKIQIRILIHGI